VLLVSIFLYLGATGGAILFWLICLALVAARILTKAALPWCAGIGAVFGCLTMVAWITQPWRCSDEPA